uniref:Endonuclease/exonuclease/phosphatase domain-containing protein n=1 Tax=Oreochromis aureus TaxID=47969 RepID=A0AAZ1WZU0_OREAU
MDTRWSSEFKPLGDLFNNLSIMSWNVKGLNNAIKKNKILSFIKSKKCDIAFVQETHLLPQDSQKLSSGTSKSRGVATLIGKHLQFKCIQKSKDDAGRMMLMLCEIQGKVVILANVYAPNALLLTSYCPRSLFQTGMFSWPEKGIKYLGVTFP